MLDRLTMGLAETLAGYRDRWLQIGLSTGPCDRRLVEVAVDQAYRCAGLAPPATHLWLGSPLAGARAAAMVAQVGVQIRDPEWKKVWEKEWEKEWDQVGDHVLKQVGANVWEKIWLDVCGKVGIQIRNKILDQFGDKVWNWIRDRVMNQVQHSIGDQVLDKVLEPIRDQIHAHFGGPTHAQFWDLVWSQVHHFGGGVHDADCLGFYEFFLCEVGIDIASIGGILALADAGCGWWWPFEGAVILTERPVLLRRDVEHRLHCEDGPAVAYADGFVVYARHGRSFLMEGWQSPHRLIRVNDFSTRIS